MNDPLNELTVALEGCSPEFCYYGMLGDELQSLLMLTTEEHTERMTLPRSMKKRMLSLSVECLQNLYHHAQDDLAVRSGPVRVFFSLGTCQANYYIASGNYVSEVVADFLRDRLEQLLSMSDAELQALFVRLLNTPGHSAKGGGGLGLVEMMRKTKRNIQFNLQPQPDGRYYFTLILNLPEAIR